MVLTATWGATFAVTALVCAYGETTGTAGDLLDWVVPVALVLTGFKLTQRYAAGEGASAVSGAEAPARPGG